MNWKEFVKDNKQAITNRNNIIKGKRLQEEFTLDPHGIHTEITLPKPKEI